MREFRFQRIMLNAFRAEQPCSEEQEAGEPGDPAKSSILPLRVDRLCLEISGRLVLDNISFKLSKGPITVILGPNGAGKTLLLKTCHGLLIPSSGRVSWREIDRALVRQGQAMVFQRSVLLKRSVAANIDYALKLRGLAKKDRIEQVERCLDMTGLLALRARRARDLSGGEQQRLALARAWAVRPEILFMDEPTASIDPPATAAIEHLIRRFAKEGVKIVMTTHDLHQAKRLAEEILFLHLGKLLEHAPAESFFARPATAVAKAFIRGELVCEPPFVSTMRSLHEKDQ
jgi:tungstate transport system ATP-binding protein